MGYKARLKKMKGAYESARKQAEEMSEDFPIGVYVMKLKSAEVGERADESLYIISKYIVVDDEEKGRQFTPFQNINEEHLEYLHKYFMDHGLTPPDIEDLEEACEKLSSAGISVKMSVFRDKGGYIKGRILSVVETGIDDTESESESESAEDDPLSKDNFLALCEKHGIDIPAKIQKKDVADIATFINDTYDVDAKDMDKADIIIFETLEVALVNTPLQKAEKKATNKKTKEKVKADDDDETINLLKEVCAGNGIDFEADDTAEQLGERLSDGYKWNAKDDGLTADHVEAMKSVSVKVNK